METYSVDDKSLQGESVTVTIDCDDLNYEEFVVTNESRGASSGDVFVENIVPQAEYMYGCTPTALGMLLGYYDLYGYNGADLSNLIEGDVEVDSRGTDGNKYNMNAFDTVLGKAIASEEYVDRFFEKSPDEEFEYSFVDGGTELNTGIWNCLADYIGTGQYWRGADEDYATRVTYVPMEYWATDTRVEEISYGYISRTVEEKYCSFHYGLQLYVESRGYSLDYEISGSYEADTRGGDFTFEDYMREIDAGRVVMVSVTGHSMVGYGYNAETREIIFDDCYDAGQRMTWGGTYNYVDEDRSLQGITVIGFNTSGKDVDLALTKLSGAIETIVVAKQQNTTESAPYLFTTETAYLNFSVTNEGADASGAFQISVYVDDVKTKSFTVTGLAAGEVRDFTDVSLGTLAAGAHAIKVVVDDGNVIQEASGQNNQGVKEIQVLNPGTQVVSSDKTIGSGASISDAFVSENCILEVVGGTANDIILRGGPHETPGYYYSAALTVSDGGIANRTIVYLYGDLYAEDGGEVKDTIVDGGKFIVEDGGAASGTQINSGYLQVDAGGVAEDTTVGKGAYLFVEGGTADGVTAQGGRIIVSHADSQVSDVTVENFGSMDLYDYTSATNVTVGRNGTVSCGENATLSGTLTVTGRIYGLTEDGAAGITQYEFVPVGKSSSAALTFASGGIAANAAITIDVTNASGNYILVEGDLSNLHSATITVQCGLDSCEITLDDNTVAFENGVEVTLEVVDDYYLGLQVSGTPEKEVLVEQELADGGTWTNQDVTLVVTAIGTAGSDVEYAITETAAQPADDSWQDGNEFTVSENGAYYAWVRDDSGWTSSAVVVVDAIDREAPTTPSAATAQIAGCQATITWEEAEDAGTSGIAEYIFYYGQVNTLGYEYSTTETQFVLEDLECGTYYYRLAAVDNAGNISQWSEVKTFTIAPANPVTVFGDATSQEWQQGVAPNGYIVEYSTDKFEHVFQVAVDDEMISTLGLPSGNYSWRVRTLECDEWVVGDEIAVVNDDTPQKLYDADIFFANATGKWSIGHLAQRCTSDDDGVSATTEVVALTGKNRFSDIFEGSSLDVNILLLTDDANGDALFVDDIFTTSYDNLATQQARLEYLDEIRAGAGDDLIDLTSLQFTYLGDGMTIRGGDGDDIIWASNDCNSLLGDAGNDRIVGGTSDDVIAGGAGDDSLHGGGGDDIFCFGGDWGHDVIEQLPDGSVALAFGNGVTSADLAFATVDDTDTKITCGDNSILVKNAVLTAENCTFGDADLADLGAFAAASSHYVFEDKDNPGILACV